MYESATRYFGMLSLRYHPKSELRDNQSLTSDAVLQVGPDFLI